jgi:hypothetical protein
MSKYSLCLRTSVLIFPNNKGHPGFRLNNTETRGHGGTEGGLMENCQGLALTIKIAYGRNKLSDQ